MKIAGLIILNLWGYFAIAQNTPKSFVVAAEFNKDEAIYEAKSYVALQVFGNSEAVLKFEIDALTATTSGELTTIYYNSPDKKEEGIVFCFYGNYWNDKGVVYKGYAFRHFNGDKARSFITKLNNCIADNEKYMYANKVNNNAYFTFEDITVLAYVADAIKFRLIWNGFDADWDLNSFKKTQKRFASKAE